jgi:hypothetical protein
MLSLYIIYDKHGQWGQFVDIEYKEEEQIIIHQESSSLHIKTEKQRLDDDDFNNILLGVGTLFIFIGYIRNYIY